MVEIKQGREGENGEEKEDVAKKAGIFLWDPPNVTGDRGPPRVGFCLAAYSGVRLALEAVRIGVVRFDL
mgnify:CR=1 FL=1